MVAGIMPPSQLLKKFASHPREDDLATALREIATGRTYTLYHRIGCFDADMQRRAQIGLNKAEYDHALYHALRIGRQSEIRDRTAEGQHYSMAGLNLLAAIIIYCNTDQLGLAVAASIMRRVGLFPRLIGALSRSSDGPISSSHANIGGLNSVGRDGS